MEVKEDKKRLLVRFIFSWTEMRGKERRKEGTNEMLD